MEIRVIRKPREQNVVKFKENIKIAILLYGNRIKIEIISKRNAIFGNVSIGNEDLKLYMRFTTR